MHSDEWIVEIGPNVIGERRAQLEMQKRRQREEAETKLRILFDRQAKLLGGVLPERPERDERGFRRAP
jgi:hypothetical protein